MKYNDYPANGDEIYEKLTKEYQNFNTEKVEMLQKTNLSPLNFLKKWQNNSNNNSNNSTNKISKHPIEEGFGEMSEDVIYKNKNNPYKKPNAFKPIKNFGEQFSPEKSCQIFEMEIDAKLTEVYENLKLSQSYITQIQKFNTNTQITTQDFATALDKTKIHTQLVKDMCGCDMYFNDCDCSIPNYNNYRHCVKDFCNIEFSIINTLLFLMFLKGVRYSNLQLKEIVEDRMKILKIPFSFI